MERRAIVSVIALAVAVLGAQAATAGNCVDVLTKGSEKDWFCTIQSDFATLPFNDCFTVVKTDRDRFAMNVLGLTPFFAPGACNSEGSLANPRFGRSENWMAQFGFPFNSPLTIVFTGFDLRDGARWYGHAINEFGDRFYYRCRPDGRDQCPLIMATPKRQANWSSQNR